MQTISTASFLYKILKVNGLAPFTYNSKRKIVQSSSVSTVRSLCTSVIVISMSLLCDTQLSKGYVPYQGKDIEFLVSHILFYYNWVKIVITIGITLYRRKELIRLINQFLSIGSNFKRFVESDRLQDDKLLMHLRNRRNLACIQIIILTSSVTCYMYRTLNLNYVLVGLCYVTVIYMNLFATLSTGIYYNGSMIVIDRFYRILIYRLKFLLITVKRKKCTNGITSSFEVASMMVADTLDVSRKIQEFFAVHVMLSSLGAFFFTLITLFNLYNSLIRKYKLNECVPITDVLIDLVAAAGFASFHLIDFYSIAYVSSMVNNMNRKLSVIVHEYWCQKLEFRLKNIIEILSFQLLDHMYLANKLRFCVINKQTTIAVLSTVASYLAILIQFELADNVQRQ